MHDAKKKTGMSAAARRYIILAALIVVVTFLWVLLLLYTNLPMLALGGIALLSLVLLSVATAWTAMAFPGRSSRT
jgi:hypothetical protein